MQQSSVARTILISYYKHLITNKDNTMIKNYKLILEYDGTKYNGWQRQGNTDNTIQGKLESTLSRYFNQPVEIHGSGRTDAGVHASGQVADFKIDTKLVSSDVTFNEAKLMDTLNDFFPEDIRITSLAEVDIRFHARLNAKQKTYRYTICLSNKEPVFNRKYCMLMSKQLDIEVMKSASKLFLGTHDLLGFSDSRTKKSTVRTIESITFSMQTINNDNYVIIDYTGDGFLYHTIRLITGTLISIGLKESDISIINEILTTKNRKQVPFMAPAKGLSLIEVIY